MEYVYAVFMLLAGIGVFLLGCNMLSNNMEAIATGKLKGLLNKTAKNKVVGVGIGTLITMVVQSSSLTTVMVVGLVNTGIIGLAQATTFIIGANIGTTITAQIAALQSFSFSKIAISLAGIGVFMNMFSKKERTKTIGNVLAGLGIIFVGLSLMSDAMSIVKESEMVVDIFSKLSNPLLLFLIGILITALIQSSSAVTSIIISMATAGLVIGNGGNSVLFLILGTNVGTCVTAVLSSVGANTNAKRASLIHLMFNLFGSVLFFIVLLCIPGFMENTFAKWFPNESTQIAMFHTFFNVTCAIIILPFTNYLVKLSMVIIKDKTKQADESLLEKRFLNTPSIAIDVTTKEAVNLLNLATDSLYVSLDSFIERNTSMCEDVKNKNNLVNDKAKEITDYLILISSTKIGHEEEKYISALHTSIGDITRISELADNIIKYTNKEIKENLTFTSRVKEELNEFKKLIESQKQNICSIMLEKKYDLLESCDIIEQDIDDMRRTLIDEHIERLNKGECKAESSSVFINLVNNLERVGDHLYLIPKNILGK